MNQAVNNSICNNVNKYITVVIMIKKWIKMEQLITILLRMCKNISNTETFTVEVW
jgi:hypothetical protein